MVGSDAQYYPQSMQLGKKTDKELVDDGGIISIANPTRYQLPVSYKNRNVSSSEVYSMSMFHQLHCLVSLAQLPQHLFADNKRTPSECGLEHWKASSMILLLAYTKGTFLRQSRM
jgi:hypothetical protein